MDPCYKIRMTLLHKVALFFPLTNHTRSLSKCFSSFLRDVHDEYVRTKNEDLILIFRDSSFLLLLSFLLTPKKRPNEVWDRCLLRMRFFFSDPSLKRKGRKRHAFISISAPLLPIFSRISFLLHLQAKNEPPRIC